MKASEATIIKDLNKSEKYLTKTLKVAENYSLSLWLDE